MGGAWLKGGSFGGPDEDLLEDVDSFLDDSLFLSLWINKRRSEVKGQVGGRGGGILGKVP